MLEIIEDLGMIPTTKSGYKLRKALYKCPSCSLPFELLTDNANSRPNSVCRVCSATRKAEKHYAKHLAIFSSRCLEYYGYTYDYSKFVYTNAITKGTIICKIHGEFMQTPNDHLNSQQGCPSCGILKASATRKDNTLATIVDRANSIHNNKYTYDNMVFTGVKDYISITCPIHGDFLQTPDKHINDGNGCPECSNLKTGFKGRRLLTDPVNLYYVYLPEFNLWKLGLTKHTNIAHRFKRWDTPVEIILVVPFTQRFIGEFIEHTLINTTYYNIRYKTQMRKHKDIPLVIPDGNYELLTEDISDTLSIEINKLEDQLFKV